MQMSTIINAWLPLAEDRLVIVFLALALNVFFVTRNHVRSYASSGINPAHWLLRFALSAEKKMNRDQRSQGSRMVRGMLVTLLLISIAYLIGVKLTIFAGNIQYGWGIEVILLAWATGWRLTHDTISKLTEYNHDMSLYETRNWLWPLSPYNHEPLDEHGVFRQSIESMGHHFCFTGTGSVLLYLIFGLPGLLVYGTLMLLERHFGHPHPHYQYYHMTSHVLFLLMSFPAMVIGGFILTMGSFFVSGGHPFKSIWNYISYLVSGGRLFPSFILSSALDIQLGGKKRYKNHTIELPWIGDGTAKVTDTHTRAAMRIYHVSILIFYALLGLAYLQLHGKLPL